MNSALYIFLIYLVPIDPFCGHPIDVPKASQGWRRIITMLASDDRSDKPGAFT